MECEFVKSSVGLIPADDATREWVNKIRLGKTIRGDFVQPRNSRFHRKFFALLNLAYEHFEETAPAIEHKGEPVRPDFERFRKDVTILAGKFHLVTNLRGEVRAEADSISFANMDEETFQKLYDKVLQVLLERVLRGPQWTRESVEETVNRILEFA